MPETLFRMHWPDDTTETCYSPSTVIAAHLDQGRAHRVRDFLDACRRALGAASDRVRQIYGGRGCSRALAQLAAIEAKSAGFAENDIVRVESIGDSWRRSA